MKIYKLKIIDIKKYYLLVQNNHNEIGYIHISNISYQYINNINDICSVGDVLYAREIGIHKNKKSYSLKPGLINEKIKFNETGGGFLALEYLLKKLEVNNGNIK